MPDASTLRSLLAGITTYDFPMWAILLGNIVAMLGLGRTFGGTWSDLLIIVINTVAIFFGCKLFNKIKLNKVHTLYNDDQTYRQTYNARDQ